MNRYSSYILSKAWEPAISLIKKRNEILHNKLTRGRGGWTEEQQLRQYLVYLDTELE